MTDADVDDVTRIHLSSFPNFFLSFLGSRFLRLLYSGILADAGGIALVAARGEEVIGFVAGVASQRGFYARLLRRRLFRFALAASTAAFRRPSIVPRLVRALVRPVVARSAAAEACLMSIAVAPNAEGRGDGQALVEAFCEALAARGIGDVCLTTDAEGNDRVNLFYQRLGFVLARQFTTPEGRHMNEYVRPTVTGSGS